MINVDEIETTNKGRFRKLLLSMFSSGAALFVQYQAGAGINWPTMALVGVVVLSFNSSDTLEKFFDSELVDKIKSKIPGVK